MEGTGLKKKDLKRFRDILLAKKKEILRNAQRTLNEDMTLDADDLPDEMDLASSEYLHSFTFRLRGREKVFLQKIDHALEKIKASGKIDVHVLTDAEKKAWIAKLMPVHAEMQSRFGKDFIQRIYKASGFTPPQS